MTAICQYCGSQYDKELTERVKSVLPFVLLGYSNSEIGREIGCKERNVKALVSRAMRYYEVPTRVSLALAYYKEQREAEAKAASVL